MARRLVHALLFGGCLVASVVLGLAGGAARSGFGAFEDEPAHVATALMLRDWLATLEPLHPVRFAEDYYAAYPKVAIGQWPPLFHGLVGLWALPLGFSSYTVLALCWLVAAVSGWLAALCVARELGAGGARHAGGELALALSAGVLACAMPLVQALASAAMTECLVAATGTLGALAFARWMTRPTAGRAAAFGVAAAAAILTKGSGLALALVPPLAALLARRPRLLLVPSLWVAPVVVGVLCAPWYGLTLANVRATWSEGASPSFDYARRAFTYYPAEVVALAGAATLALAAVGLGVRLVRPTGRERAASLGAWLLGLAAVYVVIPSSLEARHLVAGAPALAALAALGAHAVVCAARTRGVPHLGGPTRAGLLAAGLLLVPFLATEFKVVRKDCRGFEAAAEAVLANPALADATVLVASGATGEGLGVLAFALEDSPRRRRQVLRASKVLASASWTGAGYSTRFEDGGGVTSFLAEVPVAVVLLDTAPPARHRRAHLAQLRDALQGNTGTWRLAQRFDLEQDGALHPGALELWVADTLATRAPRRLSVDEARGLAPAGL